MNIKQLSIILLIFGTTCVFSSDRERLERIFAYSLQRTNLIRAVMSRNMGEVLNLWKEGANIDTFLYRFPDIIQFLISADSDFVHHKNMWGKTPLLECLLSLYVNPSSTSSDEEADNQIAVRQSIRLLLQAGADPKIASVGKMTSLHHAALIQNEEDPSFFSDLLQAQQASTVVNKKDSHGMTPLGYAITARNRYAVNALLAAGARTNIPNRERN